MGPLTSWKCRVVLTPPWPEQAPKAGPCPERHQVPPTPLPPLSALPLLPGLPFGDPGPSVMGRDVNEPSVIGPPLPSRLGGHPHTPPPPDTHTAHTAARTLTTRPRKTRGPTSPAEGTCPVTKHPWGAELGQRGSRRQDGAPHHCRPHRWALPSQGQAQQWVVGRGQVVGRGLAGQTGDFEPTLRAQEHPRNDGRHPNPPLHLPET